MQIRLKNVVRFQLKYIAHYHKEICSCGPPGVLGIWGEGQFTFRELGSIADYFRGAVEQAHTFGDLGSNAKK